MVCTQGLQRQHPGALLQPPVKPALERLQVIPLLVNCCPTWSRFSQPKASTLSTSLKIQNENLIDEASWRGRTQSVTPFAFIVCITFPRSSLECKLCEGRDFHLLTL